MSIALEISAERVPDGFDRFVRGIIEERFPEAEASVATYATGFGVGDTIFQQELDFPWEVDTFREAFAREVLPRIGPGSQGRIEVRLSEPPEIRRALEAEIFSDLTSQGGSPNAFDVMVLSAYKQGFSWLNDSVLPRLRSMAIGGIEIAYHTLKESDEVRWQKVSGSGPTNPRIMYFATTTEAPDETARGAWLQLVASAGLAHSSALLRYLATGENRIERESSEHESFVPRSVFRKKPVLPVESDETDAPEDAGR